MIQEGSLVLPAGWAKAEISDLLGAKGLFVDGDWIESKDQDPDGDVRLIQLADVGDGVFRNRSARFLTRVTALRLGCTFLNPGDVLIARLPDPLGRACIFPGAMKPAITVVDVCVVRPSPAEIDSKWLIWTINAPQFRRRISDLESGTTRGRISRRNLASLSLPVPPLAEQRRIVAEIERHFSRLDAAVAGLERALARLKRYRAAIVNAAIEGRLVPHEGALAASEGRSFTSASELMEQIRRRRHQSRAHGEATSHALMNGNPPVELTGRFTCPSNWCWATPEDISEPQRHALAIGPFGSSLKVDDYREVGVPLVFVRNIRSGNFGGSDTKYVSVSKAQALSAHYVVPGDVLVTKMGAPPGDPCVYPQSRPPAIITADCIKISVALEIPNKRYIALAISSDIVRRQIAEITSGVAQQKVSLARFKTIWIPIAPLEEQDRIVADVERRKSVADKMDASIEANLHRAERLRQSILKRAFEGRLVAQDLADEPASVLLERIRRERDDNEDTSRSIRNPRKLNGTDRRPRITADEPPYDIPTFSSRRAVAESPAEYQQASFTEENR